MSRPTDKRSLPLPAPTQEHKMPFLPLGGSLSRPEAALAAIPSATPLSLQQAGVHLLETLQLIAEALEQPAPDEETLHMAFHSLELHINVLFEAEAQLVLSGHAGCFLLNQELLDLTPEQGWRLTQGWRRLEQKGLGGVMVMRAAPSEELQTFFRQLMSHDKSPDATRALYPLTRDNAIARIDSYEREQLSKRGMEQAEPIGYAVSLYAQILQWVQQRYHPLSPRPARKVVARALKELASLCEGQQVFFLGFSAPANSPNYQLYHLTNTALLALLFGEALGLSRSQRLELALITLEHDLGKIDLPPELFQKSGPLSDEEHKTIQLLPLRTARRLLDQRFDWSRLKQALIAIDIHVHTDGDGQSADSHGDADATLFFSRIIRLCACFDALCSNRPFREAMTPDEALCFMRGTLSKRFDPELLQKFIAFLIPAIHTATGRLLHPLPPPDEHSAISHSDGSPVLEELQRLFKTYREQRCQQVASPLPHTDALRQEIVEKLQSVIG